MITITIQLITITLMIICLISMVYRQTKLTKILAFTIMLFYVALTVMFFTVNYRPELTIIYIFNTLIWLSIFITTKD